MILNNAGQTAHLGYCTNIHAGDAWHDIYPSLQAQVPKVRETLHLTDSMGIGLRLSNQSLAALQKPNTFAEFRNWLRREHVYVYTINGFHYGPFHGEKVKEDVYKPNWTDASRVEYTCQLADLLSKLDPPDNYGSIITLPGTCKDSIMPGTERLISENMIKAVAHCVKLAQKTGITIALALESEPCCLLETVSETIKFFEQYLFSADAIGQLMSLCSIDQSAAQQAMRTHIGISYDVCHYAVEYEDPVKAITRLRTAGIDIIKIQLSSALEIESVNEASLRYLSRFDEPVYVHQLVEKRGEILTRYSDVSAAISAIRHRMEARSTLHPALQLTINGDSPYYMSVTDEPEAQWRIHYKVPVFVDKTEHFNTTQQSLLDVLRLQKQFSISRHLEIDTPIWNVLPEQDGQQSVSEAIAREISWALHRL